MENTVQERMKRMDDIITYGVFWKSVWSPTKFASFSAWFSSFDAASEEYEKLLKNPGCIAAELVERTEHFEVIAGKTVAK